MDAVKPTAGNGRGVWLLRGSLGELFTHDSSSCLESGSCPRPLLLRAQESQGGNKYHQLTNADFSRITPRRMLCENGVRPPTVPEEAPADGG